MQAMISAGVALALTGCRYPPRSYAWPTTAAPVARAQEQPKVGKVLRVRMTRDLPDSAAGLDHIEVTLDRPIDPLTLDAARFSIVGRDRRVMPVERAYLGDRVDASGLVLLGRFGDTPQDYAGSLALLPGLFGADGVAIVTPRAVKIELPRGEQTP